MKSTWILSLTLAAVFGWSAFAANQDPPDTGQKTDSRPARKTSRLNQKEENFKSMLEHSEARGVWQMTGHDGLAGKAPLSDPKPEHYTVDTVSKGSGDYWIISARIQYAEKDVTI